MADLSRSYQQEDLQEILNLAITRQGNSAEFTREQLEEIAEDMGISSIDLRLAEQEWLTRQDQHRQKQEFNLYRRRQWQKKFISYALTNGFLITLNLAFAGQISWAWYILGFWSLSLGIHTWSVFKPSSGDYEEAFLAWQRKQQIKQTVSSLWNRFNRFLES